MASKTSERQRSANFYDLWLEELSSFLQDLPQRLRARSPQLVALIICVAALPVLLLFSFIAGWIVWSSVPQGWYVPIYLQYGDWTSPYADLEITTLSTTQPYEISLRLSVPATETNFQIGNFMASLNVTTFSDEPVAFVRKPAIIIPPSPSRLPLSRPSRLLDLSVPLASSLVTSTSRVKAHIELGRKDGWKTLGKAEGQEISVHSAWLHAVVRPQGLHRILASAPLTFAVAAAVLFFSVSSLILAACLLPSVVQSEPAPPGAAVKSEEPTSSLEEPGAATRIRLRSSRVKEESDAEEASSPLAGPGPGSVVRRRSRRASSGDDD